MEREEAIKWLTNEKWKNANNKYKKEWNEAFDLAIEALQDDVVSRKAKCCPIAETCMSIDCPVLSEYISARMEATNEL